VIDSLENIHNEILELDSHSPHLYLGLLLEKTKKTNNVQKN